MLDNRLQRLISYLNLIGHFFASEGWRSKTIGMHTSELNQWGRFLIGCGKSVTLKNLLNEQERWFLFSAGRELAARKNIENLSSLKPIGIRLLAISEQIRKLASGKR